MSFDEDFYSAEKVALAMTLVSGHAPYHLLSFEEFDQEGFGIPHSGGKEDQYQPDGH